MATVKFYLKEPNSLGETPIYLAFNSGEKRFKFYTGKKIHPKKWDEDNQRPIGRFKGELKSYLKSLAGDAEKIHTQFQTMNRPFSLEDIRKKLCEQYERTIKEEPLTFFQFIDQYISSVENLKRPQTVSAYKTSLESLREFQKKYRRKINFNSMDLDFYNDYTQWLMNERKYSNNTIGKYIKHLKLFLNEATERGLNKKMDFKSTKFKILSEEAESIYLTEEEILLLFNLDLSQNRKLETVRDLFIVGCYTGLRFSDFTQIKKENIKDGFISIRTQKTDKPVVIPIHWTIQKILDKYCNKNENSLPRAISNQKMNEYLKEIGKKAEIKEMVLVTKSKGGLKVKSSVQKYELISTHTARRSLATNLFLQGFPSISIMKITGHKSEKAFLKYIKMTPEENAIKLKQFWSEQPKKMVV